MKYTITHRCGHTSEIQLVGKETERARTIARLATEDCPACRKAEATQDAGRSGLPALSGSDKQVAWATSIRQEALDSLTDIGAPQKVAQAIIATNTKAGFWIDNRNLSGNDISNKLRSSMTAVQVEEIDSLFAAERMAS